MQLLLWSVYMLNSTLSNKYVIAPLERLHANKYVHYLVYMLISTLTNKFVNYLVYMLNNTHSNNYVIAPLERLHAKKYVLYLVSKLISKLNNLVYRLISMTLLQRSVYMLNNMQSNNYVIAPLERLHANKYAF